MSDEPSKAVELREQLDSLCNDECLNEEAVGLLDDFGYDAITALEAAEARDRQRGEEIAAWLLLVGVDILGLDGAPDAGEDEGLGISPVGRQLTFVSAALRSYKRRADERGEEIAQLENVLREILSFRDDLLVVVEEGADVLIFTSALDKAEELTAVAGGGRDKGHAPAEKRGEEIERLREALTPLAGLTQGMHQFLAACRNQGLFDGDDGELRCLADDWIGEMEEQHYAIGAALAADAAAPDGKHEAPPVVCLCGSTRFMEAFFEAGFQFTLSDIIVLSVAVCKHAEHHGAEALGQDVADRLDELHKRKIDLADAVFVLDVGGYVGKSTQEEIDYATARGKPLARLTAHAKGDACDLDAVDWFTASAFVHDAKAAGGDPPHEPREEKSP